MSGETALTNPAASQAGSAPPTVMLTPPATPTGFYEKRGNDSQLHVGTSSNNFLRDLARYIAEDDWSDWEHVSSEIKAHIGRIEGVEEVHVLGPGEYVWESNVFVVAKLGANIVKLVDSVSEAMVDLIKRYPKASISTIIVESPDELKGIIKESRSTP